LELELGVAAAAPSALLSARLLAHQELAFIAARE
jgi:hypothetical protein